ncbi:alanine racemase [Kutzneria kofuensis]|uniref:Alanine racemase n=1 Tax=Kutzneria kofuensis TaxID=103725 RepID=A0A7W9NH84_9PSEU|nr:alanine racemase [Kutzneria kofuensis]MBB5893302.1 alanine racemase [Kutzneria kofuensis]
MADQHNPLPRAEVRIDLDAVKHNVELLTRLAVRSGAQTMAVVKADGYGHGAVAVGNAALAAGASWLGVASVDEALELRAAGIQGRIFCWLHTVDDNFGPAVAAGIHLSVSSLRQLWAVNSAARAVGTEARIHLKIDTGLTRGGCQPADWPALVEAAASAHDEGTVEIAAVWSHLANADEPGHPSVDVQAARLDEAYKIALDAGLHPIRHLANSAATLTRPDLHFDLVRPGIAVYGLNPVPGTADLKPAMTFRSSVSLARRVPAGESVSYGHTWTAEKDTTLALVPVGYADGVPRSLSNRMDVWLGGTRRPIVGRVCMDQIVVDCGDDPITDGDEVVLFGPGDHGEPTAREWADKTGTIDYEIVTGMYRPRVRRTYIGGSR